MLICSCLRVILKHLNLTGPRGAKSALAALFG
jgi:hypothetical protein